MEARNPECASTSGFVFSKILGDSLVSRRGRIATDKALQDKRVVGLYFAASVCERCRLFTPALATVYRNMHLKQYQDLTMKHDLEIVMVSVDGNASAFHDFLLQTPFLAMPIERRDLTHALLHRYGVKRMPSVVFVDETAQVIERNGRELIERNYDDLHTIWTAVQARLSGK